MGRFLIYFSYIGTRYSGVQQQIGALKNGRPVQTVGGILEEALSALRPANQVRIQISSRTDKGVHALRNSCHVDLQHQTPGLEYDPSVITNVTNYSLRKRGEDVRVLETRLVPVDFHSRRNATGRKYVYRLAHVTKPGPTMHLAYGDQSREAFVNELKRHARRSKHLRLPTSNLTSTLDTDKVQILKSRLDIGKLLQAASLLSGIHDFTSFSCKSDTPPHPLKLLTVGIKRGQPLGQSFLAHDTSLTENVEFWDIHVQSKSFLYKMVRRCVGGMVLVAQDIISLSDLKELLANPNQDFPLSSRLGFSETGLFLADVAYNPKDFCLDVTKAEMSYPKHGAQTAENSCQSEHDKGVNMEAESNSENSPLKQSRSTVCEDPPSSRVAERCEDR